MNCVCAVVRKTGLIIWKVEYSLPASIVAMGCKRNLKCRLAFAIYINLSGKRRKYGGVIKWKYSPRYLPFVRGIHRSSMDSRPKDQCRGTLIFSLMCVWTNGWANNRDACDLSLHGAHCEVTAMKTLRYTVFSLLIPEYIFFKTQFIASAIGVLYATTILLDHDDVMKWGEVRGIHRSP